MCTSEASSVGRKKVSGAFSTKVFVLSHTKGGEGVGVQDPDLAAHA